MSDGMSNNWLHNLRSDIRRYVDQRLAAGTPPTSSEFVKTHPRWPQWLDMQSMIDGEVFRSARRRMVGSTDALIDEVE